MDSRLEAWVYDASIEGKRTRIYKSHHPPLYSSALLDPYPRNIKLPDYPYQY